MKKLLLLFLVFCVLLCYPAAVLAEESSENLIQTGSTGVEVILVQQKLRELGYLNYRVTGKYSDMTYQAVRRFQQNNSLPDDGQIGQSTYDLLFSGTALIAAKNPDFKNVYGPYIETPAVFGEAVSWSDINALFTVGSQAVIKDLYSNKTFHVVRTGGINNARIETVSAEDTAAFVEMFGGGSTWEKRPVLATINNVTYAASLFGAPDGEDTIAGNDMQGGTQLFFLESLSDVLSLRDDEHDTSIMKAAGKTA